jgi:transcription-repair coupling factor (superfamily II helicase)
LRNNRFANPGGLVELIQKHAGTLKLRPDQKLVYLRNWDDPAARLKGVAGLLQALVKLVRSEPTAPPVAPMPPPTPELVKVQARAGGRR